MAQKRRGDGGGRQERLRPGNGPLLVLARALSAEVLRAHAGGALSRAELKAVLGSAPTSSMRAALGELAALGAVAREGSRGGRSELTPAGRELAPVLDALERWLAEAPQGPLSLEQGAGRRIVRRLVDAWDSGVVRALAERPCAGAELSARVPAVNEAALLFRLERLRSASLLRLFRGAGAARYGPTQWLCRSVTPLVLAGRWELRHGAAPTPLSGGDAEAALLLALPQLELSPRASGACTLAVLTPDRQAAGGEVAGVLAELELGAIASLATGGGSDPSTWALGTVPAWLEGVVDGRGDRLRIGGARPWLARHLVGSIRDGLLCVQQARRQSLA